MAMTSIRFMDRLVECSGVGARLSVWAVLVLRFSSLFSIDGSGDVSPVSVLLSHIACFCGELPPTWLVSMKWYSTCS